MSNILKLFVFILLLFSFCRPDAAFGAARTPAALSRPFTHYAERQDLPAVLLSFARSQGLAGSVTLAVKGSISGRFTNVSPAEFLGGIEAAYKVNWYIRDTTLHFYSEEERTEAFITPKTMAAQSMFSMMAQSGLFSQQLYPRLAGSIIRVFGPPDYVNRIVSAAQALEAAQGGNVVMRVFPLKYAWADDISLQSMGKNITVPGVASILRAMLGGPRGGGHQGTSVRQEPSAQSKLNGTGMIAMGREGGREDASASGQSQSGAATADSHPGVNIMADSRVNSVVVSDSAYRMPYYEKVIKDLDVPVELVEIHAAIVDIDVDNTQELGINYQGGVKGQSGWGAGGELGSGAAVFRPIPTPGTITTTGLSLSTIYTHGADYFLARVTALESKGNARVLGKPSVLTVDNVQASLENTTTYYVTVEGYQATDLYKVEAGTVLKVTPHIIREKDGRAVIKLAVNVQDAQSNSASTAPLKAGQPPDPIKQTTINTQAIVGAGESLLIGGYYYEKKTNDVSGIPVLMHIPILGHLFKTTSYNTKRVERLILITPKVIGINDLPKVPERVDEPSFHQSPTQAGYEDREPAVKRSGCARIWPRHEEDKP